MLGLLHPVMWIESNSREPATHKKPAQALKAPSAGCNPASLGMDRLCTLHPGWTPSLASRAPFALGLYRDNGKSNGNYDSILGLYRVILGL